MLSRDALHSALPLTEALDNAGLFLTPVENTPLAALVNATRSDENFVDINNNEVTIDIGNIEYIANKKDDALGFSPHDIAMDDIVEVASRAVQGHMVFARTVVAPAVQELAEKTAQTLRDITPSVLTGMEVVVWNPPKPLENSTLEASVRRFEETPFDAPAMALRLPSKTAQEIIELLQTGSAGLDADIREWASAKGDSFFLNLWEEAFQQKQAGLNDLRVKTFTDFVNDRECGLDNTLAIYLLARRLTDEPLEGTEMPLPLYEKTIVEFRNQAGLRLVGALADLDRAVKSGVLVRSATDRVTHVNGPVYRKWIEAGGENEVLFGNLLNQPVSITVEQLTTDAEKLKAIWNRHCALTATVENNRRFARTKAVLEKHFREQLFAITEGEEATAGNRETVLKLFNEHLERVRESDLDDLYGIALRLLCRSRFYRTDAERILEGISRVQKENPNIDVREAAAISVIEYVAYWLSSQFKVTAF